MRQRSATVTVMYAESTHGDMIAANILDHIDVDLIDYRDRESIVDFHVEIHDATDVDESDPMWADSFWEGEDDE